MPRYSQDIIITFLTTGNDGATTAIKGKAFEDLTCYLFDKIPGVEITQRNTFNTYNTEEIDIAIWNEKRPNGLYFLPHIVLIECKNWGNPVGSMEVSWFASKLEERGRDYGILIANNGITGDPADLTNAHHIIATHLAKGRYLIVINRNEIMQLRTPKDLIKLIKQKLCVLTVSGRIG